MSRDLDAEARGWRAQADELVEFADEHLVNRRDVWGGYLPVAKRATLGKLRTAPTKARRGLDFLTDGVIRRHVIGNDEGDIIGLHAVSPENTSRWAAFDLDAHGDVDDARRAQLRDALDWLTDVWSERCAVLREDSDGSGGYHVWAHFDAPVPTDALYTWLQRIATECHAVTGVKPETYPKQAAIEPDGYGSWLRLPGRHHTRPHWSRLALAGEPWQAGADAAACLLRWPATPADVVPSLDAWPVPIIEHISTILPRVVQRLDDTPANRARVIAAYVNRLPHGQAGTERSNRLFALARFLRHGMCCTDGEALQILTHWDAGNTPPLGEKKIVSTWTNAALYAASPFLLRASTGGRDAA